MRKWFNVIFITAITSITVYLLFRTNELSNIAKLFGKINQSVILLAVLSMALYLYLEALMLHILINWKYNAVKFWVSVKSMFIGQYYSLLTPFASGGQPMQLVEMVKDGLSGTYSTAVLVNKFLYFQIGVTVYSLLLVVLRFDKIVELIQKTYGVIGIGIAVNFVGLASILLMIFKPDMIKAIVDFLLKIARKFKIKDQKIEKFRVKAYRTIDEITESVRVMLFDKRIILKLVILTFIQLSAYFGITYFIYRAFGYDQKTLLDILTVQSVLYMSISLIPAPGSAGVAEGGFLIVFQSVFPQNAISSALLIWRGITYYLNLVVSGIITLSIGFGKIIK